MPAYDLVSEVCSAQWFVDYVQQPCQSSASDKQGAIRLVTSPVLEDGSTFANPAILISPDRNNGPIQGIYPEYLVQPGDHFRAVVGCEMNSTSCSALLRVSYKDVSSTVVDLWATGEFHDQKFTRVDIDLGALAGQNVSFILEVTPLNADPGNHVIWASPAIHNEPMPTATATIVPTATVTILPTNTATAPPLPTTTLSPLSTPTPSPQPETPSIWDKIQNFFKDVFSRFSGG
jgi:hypothetical protein